MIPEIVWPVLQSESDTTPIPCPYIILVFIILLILYAALKLYQHFYGSKKQRQHLCEYCGHMVNVVSNCCHAPVAERFLHGECQNCGKDCSLVCTRCKNRV